MTCFEIDLGQALVRIQTSNPGFGLALFLVFLLLKRKLSMYGTHVIFNFDFCVSPRFLHTYVVILGLLHG